MNRSLARAIAAAALILIPFDTRAAEWYAGPKGTPDGKGTRDSPWDIGSAFGGKLAIKPGDTLFVLGGTYRRRPQENFEIRLAGTDGKPVHVRPAPGERTIIDGGLAVMEPSTHLWIWDLEILVSEPQPSKPVGPGSWPKDFTRPWGGLNIYAGKGCKYIGLVIHDCRQGVSWWSGSRDSEIHGCLIYENGWRATDRGHGHAIYTQNQDGTKWITDCIMTGGHGYTLHAYGSRRAYVDNYVVEGNICYDGGTFLVGGGRPSRNIRVSNNYLHGVSMQIGYDAPHNEDCEVRDNVIVNGGLSINRYQKAVSEGNLLLEKSAKRPEGARAILRPNKYETDRANLAVFNWQKKSVVAIDASSFLKSGDHFRLVKSRDFFGKPVLSGVYDGRPVRIPVIGEFAAFVFLRGLR